KDAVIVSAVFKCENRAESREEILREYLAYSAKRRESQPLNMPSAGSTFKRPANGFASRLIDEAGLKGFRIGDAEVSTKHAGFVVNRGGATAEDVLKVIEAVRKTVFEKTGVTLDPEIVYLE
ncbi:MAG: UDP-N-acetylenolpyruvoylglucosamine reductase, partial [Clostridia bacterium]|nr:UDP-N-acetylenolpyruvoylglucosamine reductase [Clostridia bacterium]